MNAISSAHALEKTQSTADEKVSEIERLAKLLKSTWNYNDQIDTCGDMDRHTQYQNFNDVRGGLEQLILNLPARTVADALMQMAIVSDRLNEAMEHFKDASDFICGWKPDPAEGRKLLRELDDVVATAAYVIATSHGMLERADLPLNTYIGITGRNAPIHKIGDALGV